MPDMSDQEIEQEFVKAVVGTLPDLPRGSAQEHVREFIDMVGRLYEVVSEMQPTQARRAAFVYFFHRMHFDVATDEASATLMRTLVETAASLPRPNVQ